MVVKEWSIEIDFDVPEMDDDLVDDVITEAHAALKADERVMGPIVFYHHSPSSFGSRLNVAADDEFSALVIAHDAIMRAFRVDGLALGPIRNVEMNRYDVFVIDLGYPWPEPEDDDASCSTYVPIRVPPTAFRGSHRA